MKWYVSHCEELLEVHIKSYQSVVDGGILLDHFTSLRHGLRLIRLFFDIDTYTYSGVESLITHVNKKLYSLSHLRKDESLVMKLDREYSHLREQMKNVITYPATSRCLILPRSFSSNPYIATTFDAYKKTSLLFCEIIEELVSSDCKAYQIRPVRNELEAIRKILPLLEPFYEYGKNTSYHQYEGSHNTGRKILINVKAAMEKITCFLYSSAVGKMDDQMLISMMSISSDLIAQETQIMDMYLSLDVDSTINLECHISMSLRLLGWNKRCYLGTELGEQLEDHFTSIEHGLQYLVRILQVSENEEFKLRVLRLIDIMKQKLYSLSHSQNNENLRVNLEHAYGELREEMKNVVINPGTNDYDTLFPKFLEHTTKCIHLHEIMELTLLRLTSSSKADEIAPIMKETKELMKKLTSLKPLFDFERYELDSVDPLMLVNVHAAVTAFLDKATCLLYFSMVAKLNEDMFVSLRKKFSLLIEETEIKKMSLDSGFIFNEDFESDIDISLSLLKRHQENHIYTINDAMLEDHIISLKHGIEFLKWFYNINSLDEDFKRCIMLLAGNVKQKLELLTYKQEDESLNMDVNGACAVLREEMKNVIIREKADKHETLFAKFKSYDCHMEELIRAYLRRNYDFLVEKITTLVTSNCKADQIALLTKGLQELQKRLKTFKPLGLYICGIPIWRNKKQFLKTLLTFLHKATFLIYLTFVGTMDIEMILSVKSSISIAIKETDDIQEIYTYILNQFWFEGHYKVKELYLLENLMILLENNDELNEGNYKLQKVLVDIHNFLLALPSNVILRKLHLLQESFEDILRHSIPIVYSCYLDLTEVDISVEFNCVCELIKHIKSETLQTKLYYFPRVDDLGFLEFLLGYLEDLMKSQEILLKEEIGAFHFEVVTLLSLTKSRNQEQLDKNPWSAMMNLAYQAEYIIDLYLISSPRDLGLISSLSKIIQQLHNIRADAILDLSHLYQTPHQPIGLTRQVRDNDEIFGLQEETKSIMDDLLNGENELNVVSIIGMAGVGKTTLALTLYDSPIMAAHFDIRAKCVVSQSYQRRALLVSLLDQVNAPYGSHRNISNFEELADHFCRCLKKHRYLIILDDVWDTKLWNDLKRRLPDDRIGSRILITTRNREIADQIESKVNELHGLSDENSWELFRKKMIQIECLSDRLLTISKGIVKSCKGLPLSVVIVAGILSGIERTEEKWNQIAKSVNSFVLSEAQGNCRSILELSYNNLPNHLRSCFLYLGSFPEDEEISVNRLILLWIGEGFVQDTEIDTAEELAKKHVECLIVKSLVIPVKKKSRGGVRTIRLHDLLRDFCIGKAKEKQFFTFLGEEVIIERNYFLALQDPRRIIMSEPSYRESSYRELSYRPTTKEDFSFHSVRSMICHGRLDIFSIKKKMGSCDMVLLRVLEVDEACATLLSVCDDWGNYLEDISRLVHLRYFAFHGGASIGQDSVLTSSISKLQNLQILILKLARIIIPDFIWDMVKLRHIHILEASFEVGSNRLQNSSVLLENLKYLSMARVSYGDSKWLSRLSGLQTLHCSFSHFSLTNDVTEVSDDIDVDDVTEVNGDIEVNDVTEVDHTEMDGVTEVSDYTLTDDDTEVDDDVEDNQSRMLSFNETLISLKVKKQSNRLLRFISTFQLPKSLRKLTLAYFYLKSNDISIIGQTLSHLEVFKINSCYVPSAYEWNVDDEDFPELKVLKLKYLKISKWTVSEDSFPNLEQLRVENCDCLDVIPLEFGSLWKLLVISVKNCPPSVDNSAREIEKEQHDSLNVEMRVHISKR